MASFGRAPTITESLKELLDLYPDGSQIFSELIQNADDASATKVKIVFDKRKKEVEGIIPEIQEFSGDSILFYNDSVFTERDYQSFQNIKGNSEKQHDYTKIGSFGLGFKSVYHITDLPSFISEDQYVILDPHERYFKDENNNPTLGRRYNFVSSDLNKLFPNQMNQFQIFNNNNKSVYPGTIFCFPIRTINQASSSKISASVHTEEHVDEWFAKIKEDSSYLLLFLKSVIEITLYKRIDNDLVEIFSVKKVADSEEQRLLIPNLIHRLFTNKMKRTLENGKEIEEEEYFAQKEMSCINSSCYIATVMMNDPLNHTNSEKKFLISQYLDDKDAYKFSRSKYVRNYAMKLLPWTGIAIPLFEDAQSSYGKSFCFLPLPINTGLPILLHGFFSVSSNRRDLWKGDDLSKESKDGLKVQWNNLLLKHCLPINYLLAISFLKKYYLSSPPSNNNNNISNNNIEDDSKRNQRIAELIYQYLPRSLSNDFQSLVEGFYQRLLNRSIFTSGYINSGDQWVFPEDVIVFTEDQELYSTIIQKLFVEIREKHTTVKFATNIPLSLLEEFKKYGFTLCQFNTQLARKLLREYSSNLNYNLISQHELATLIDYLLSDENCLDEFLGIPILPTVDHKSFKSILCSSRMSDVVFYKSEDFPDELIRPQMQSCILSYTHYVVKLLELIRTSLPPRSYNLKKLDATQYLQHFLPILCNTKDIHQFRADMTILWHHFETAIFETLPPHPIVLSHNSKKFLPSKITSLYSPSKLFHRYEDKAEQFVSILSECGFEFIDTPHSLSDSALMQPKELTLQTILQMFQSSTKEISAYLTSNPSAVNEIQILLVDHINSDKKAGNISVLRTIPIFFTNTGKQCCLSRKEIKQNFLVDQSTLALISQFQKFLPSSTALFCSENKVQRFLLKQLEVKKCSLHTLLVLIIKNISRPTSDIPTSASLIELIISNFDIAATKEIIQLISGWKVILCANKNYTSLSDCFSPTSFELISRLYTPTFEIFPTLEIFRNLDLLIQLESFIPLRKCLTDNEFLQCCSSKGAMKSFQQCEDLLEYFLTFHPTVKSDKILLQLKDIPWIPVHPTEGIPEFFSERAYVTIPLLTKVTKVEIVSSQYQSICFSQCFIISNARKELFTKLQLNSTPSISSVIKHLIVLSKHTSTFTGELSHDLSEYINSSVIEIFRFLGQNANQLKESNLKKIKSFDSIWNNKTSRFYSFRNFIEEESDALPPYVFRIPDYILNQSSLCKKLNIPKHIPFEDKLGILEDIYLKHKELNSNGNIHPLSAEIVEITLKLLTGIYNYVLKSKKLPAEVPLLAINNCLYPAKTILFNDRPSKHEYCPNNFFLLSNHLSNDLARKLGAKGISEIIAEESSLFKKFDLRESLTDRISKIVRDYGSNFNMIKELLQNAEDANATYLKIIIDKSTYPVGEKIIANSSSLFSSSLIAINDSVFTDDDFQGLACIGRGSKREENKIGKFGLGFNSAYYYTNNPSIISSGKFLLLDPANLIVNTGIILDIEELAAKDITDMLHPYRWIPEFNRPSTIIRLPFRYEADNSVLCPWKYNEEKIVDEIVGSVKSWISTALLFLKNILKIAIYVKENGKVTKLYKVSKDDKALRESVKTQKISKCSIEVMSYNHEFDDNQVSREEWLVINNKNSSSYSEHRRENNNNDDDLKFPFKVFPSGSIAFPITTPLKQFVGKLFCYLPIEVTHPYPFHVSGYFILDSSRKDLVTDIPKEKEWNILIFRYYVAPAYARLLEIMDKYLKHKEIETELLPVRRSVDDSPKYNQFWGAFIEEFYRFVCEQDLCIFSTNNGIYGIKETTFVTDPNLGLILRSFSNINICILENLSVLEELRKQSDSISILTPEILCAYLKEKRNRGEFTRLSKTEKGCLLEYIFTVELPLHLNDLNILPLMNGSCGHIRFIHDSKKYYLLIDPAVQQFIQKKDENRMLNIFPSNMKVFTRVIDLDPKINLRVIDLESLPQYIEEFIFPDLVSEPFIEGSSENLTLIRNLITLLDNQPQELVSKYIHFPLVIHENRIYPIKRLGVSVFISDDTDNELVRKNTNMFHKLNLIPLSKLNVQSINKHLISHIFKLQHIVQMLKNNPDVQQITSKLLAAEKKVILNLIIQSIHNDPNSISDDDKRFISSLPIFKSTNKESNYMSLDDICASQLELNVPYIIAISKSVKFKKLNFSVLIMEGEIDNFVEIFRIKHISIVEFISFVHEKNSFDSEQKNQLILSLFEDLTYKKKYLESKQHNNNNKQNNKRPSNEEYESMKRLPLFSYPNNRTYCLEEIVESGHCLNSSTTMQLIEIYKRKGFICPFVIEKFSFDIIRCFCISNPDQIPPKFLTEICNQIVENSNSNNEELRKFAAELSSLTLKYLCNDVNVSLIYSKDDNHRVFDSYCDIIQKIPWVRVQQSIKYSITEKESKTLIIDGRNEYSVFEHVRVCRDTFVLGFVAPFLHFEDEKLIKDVKQIKSMVEIRPIDDYIDNLKFCLHQKLPFAEILLFMKNIFMFFNQYYRLITTVTENHIAFQSHAHQKQNQHQHLNYDQVKNKMVYLKGCLEVIPFIPTANNTFDLPKNCAFLKDDKSCPDLSLLCSYLHPEFRQFQDFIVEIGVKPVDTRFIHQKLKELSQIADDDIPAYEKIIEYLRIKDPMFFTLDNPFTVPTACNKFSLSNQMFTIRGNSSAVPKTILEHQNMINLCHSNLSTKFIEKSKINYSNSALFSAIQNGFEQTQKTQLFKVERSDTKNEYIMRALITWLNQYNTTSLNFVRFEQTQTLFSTQSSSFLVLFSDPVMNVQSDFIMQMGDLQISLYSHFFHEMHTTEFIILFHHMLYYFERSQLNQENIFTIKRINLADHSFLNHVFPDLELITQFRDHHFSDNNLSIIIPSDIAGKFFQTIKLAENIQDFLIFTRIQQLKYWKFEPSSSNTNNHKANNNNNNNNEASNNSNTININGELKRQYSLENSITHNLEHNVILMSRKFQGMNDNKSVDSNILAYISPDTSIAIQCKPNINYYNGSKFENICRLGGSYSSLIIKQSNAIDNSDEFTKILALLMFTIESPELGDLNALTPNDLLEAIKLSNYLNQTFFDYYSSIKSVQIQDFRCFLKDILYVDGSKVDAELLDFWRTKLPIGTDDSLPYFEYLSSFYSKKYVSLSDISLKKFRYPNAMIPFFAKYLTSHSISLEVEENYKFFMKTNCIPTLDDGYHILVDNSHNMNTLYYFKDIDDRRRNAAELEAIQQIINMIKTRNSSQFIDIQKLNQLSPLNQLLRLPNTNLFELSFRESEYLELKSFLFRITTYLPATSRREIFKYFNNCYLQNSNYCDESITKLSIFSVLGKPDDNLYSIHDHRIYLYTADDFVPTSLCDHFYFLESSPFLTEIAKKMGVHQAVKIFKKSPNNNKRQSLELCDLYLEHQNLLTDQELLKLSKYLHKNVRDWHEYIATNLIVLNKNLKRILSSHLYSGDIFNTILRDYPDVLLHPNFARYSPYNVCTTITTESLIAVGKIIAANPDRRAIEHYIIELNKLHQIDAELEEFIRSQRIFFTNSDQENYYFLNELRWGTFEPQLRYLLPLISISCVPTGLNCRLTFDNIIGNIKSISKQLIIDDHELRKFTTYIQNEILQFIDDRRASNKKEVVMKIITAMQSIPFIPIKYRGKYRFYEPKLLSFDITETTQFLAKPPKSYKKYKELLMLMGSKKTVVSVEQPKSRSHYNDLSLNFICAQFNCSDFSDIQLSFSLKPSSSHQTISGDNNDDDGDNINFTPTFGVSNDYNNNNNNNNNNDNTNNNSMEGDDDDEMRGEVVYLHKIILASRSQPLKEICLKSKNNIIYCEDLFWKISTMKREDAFDMQEKKLILALLRYLYTLEFSLPSNLPLDNLSLILHFATAFDLPDLKDLVTYELLDEDQENLEKKNTSDALSPEFCFEILKNFPEGILSDCLKSFCLNKIKNSRPALREKSLNIDSLPDYVRQFLEFI